MFSLKMCNKAKSTIGIILIICLSACGTNASENDSENTVPTSSVEAKNSDAKMDVIKGANVIKEANQEMTLIGQILYQQMEGGFYGFVANNGDKYLPSGLKSEYRKNGLIVELKVQLMPDILTTQQFGEVVKILEIKVLDTSKVSDTHQTM